MRRKRGQLVQEFIITYGWVMIVVLVMLFVLAYYGFLNLDMFIDDKCEFSAGFDCEDYTWDEKGFSLTIRNGMGFDVQNISIQIDPKNLDVVCVPDEMNESIGMLNTESRMFLFNCSSLSSQTIFKSDLLLYFETGETDMPHQKTGVLVAKLSR